jgi:hypothetical protein
LAPLSSFLSEFYVSYIPVRIKPCWDLAVEFESSTDIQNFAVRSGFLMDASLSLGVEYDKVNEDWIGEHWKRSERRLARRRTI